eukprot:CCRYP_013543-RA/>CCRYP_013543-RA protein AED:0.18 eAED:0.18 QI:543/1/1/1/0.66/0.5/4/285/692
MEKALAPLALLLFLSSTLFVLHYAKRSTSIFVISLSILSFGLGSAAVALLPIDLSYASITAESNNTATINYDAVDASNQTNDEKTSSIADPTVTNPTYIPWQVTYWTTFFLAWFILPITRETLHSGQFTLFSQLKEGVSTSLRGIGIMIVVGILVVIVMAIRMHSFHLVTVLMPVLMAWGNTYGLVLVSLLLGNGLVNIPKKYWRQAHPGNELRRIRIVACGAEEELFDAVMDLEDAERKIEEVCAAVVQGEAFMIEGSLRNENMGDDDDGVEIIRRRGRRLPIRFSCGSCSTRVDDASQFHDYLEILVKRKNETLELNLDRRTERRSGSLSQHSNGNTRTDNMMDMKYLVELNAQLKKAQERVNSAQLHWDHLLEHNRLFSALIDEGIDGDSSRATSNSSHGPASSTLLLSSTSTQSSRCCIQLRYGLQRLWIRHLRYHTYRFAAILTATLSIFVLISEVTLAAPVNLSPFSWLLHVLDEYDNSILFQIAALIPLLYISICVYTCLFQMSLLGPYCLRGNRQSHGVALVFNAQYLVRLQFPLGYNYLMMLKYDMTNCSFHSIMSDMSTIPFFGTSFTFYAPLLILAVCAFTLCDAYPKLLHLLGIEHEDALLLLDQETLDGKVNEGIQLLKRDADKKGDEAASHLSNKMDNSAPRRSPDKMALVSRDNDDDNYNMNGSCRGRYSEGINVLV